VSASGPNKGRQRRHEPPEQPLATQPCWCGRFRLSTGQPLPYEHTLGAHPEFWDAYTTPEAQTRAAYGGAGL
jgi:hypothetical protein